MSHNNAGFVSSRDSVISTDLQRTQNSNRKPSDNSRKTVQNEIYSVEFQSRRKPSQNLETTYEPYDNRMVKKPTSTFDTLFHLLKGSLGTGILAMPQAFSHSGYAVGLVATILIGIFCTYSIHILIRSSYELCKRRRVPALSYQETAKAAFQEGPKFLRRFASASAHIVNAFLLVYQLGTCIVYTVFIATNFQKAFLEYTHIENLLFYMLLMLIPLILINWIKNLKLLAPVSKIANVITFASFAIIIYYMFKAPKLSEKVNPIGEVAEFPFYFGTVLFALEAIGVILPLENEMKNPKKFKSSFGVLNIGMASITILYTLMGFFGYISYGRKIEASITLNLPTEEIYAKIAQVMLAIAIFMTHPLQCYVAIEILWDTYIKKIVAEERKFWFEYVLRTLVVIGTFILAWLVPRIDLFISLFGSLCLSALALAFPAIIETCTFWSAQRKSQNTIMLVKNGLIVLFAVLGLISGTYVSMTDIIKYIWKNNETSE